MNNGEDSTFILKFAPNAIYNLDEIEIYIAKTAGLKIAERVIDKLLDRCDQLTRIWHGFRDQQKLENDLS